MRSHRRLRLAICACCSAFAITGALALAACSSSSTPAPGVDAGGTGDSSGGTDSSMGTDSTPGKDAAPAPENDCTTFVDRTDATAARKIQWDLGVVSIPERCIKVKAGQIVTWANGAGAADFSSHPIVVYKPGGGAAPTVNTTSGEATFPTAGLFGFACQIHPQMRGVVLVE